MKKLCDIKHRDNERHNEKGDINYKDVIDMIKIQKSKCWLCKNIFLCSNWKPYCCYQFSINKIDYSKSRNKDNFRISCLYCICKDHPKFDQYNKNCRSGCH